MTTPTLHGHWFTPDRGQDLLVVGPSLGTGVVALWGRCAEALAGSAEVDVLGWDLPGHGEGDPVDAPFTLDELAAGVMDLVDRARPGARFVHAGVSVAGLTSLALATSGRVLGVAVICSDARVGTTQGWRERADLVRRSGTSVMVEGSAQRWFAPGFLEREARVAGGLLTTLEHADAASYARVCEALATADYRDAAADIAVPVLVMGGRHDPVCTPEQQQALAAAVPGARLVILEDAAHLAPAESPLEVAEVLADWLPGAR
ncbi:alpha/beta fold hydrolase [Ornithinimicrobium cerasi]|uniref:3-oxoadipate enol-lactonase/3-oxoadipate enol-lactonase / 4-carboxymuconolactone decarboxylase n=1 Tax=Ornithinimicrobium cerasi TaxID=2248773 RepID=A0A285VHH2_9MICO|nr:alpha/beta hydrolase [Ornithinimicrobium cerasi]SOC53525.1 3-oxoadipate enol-lactonase/3-oxoadipate enol-lactonase / 4-carboxymuconolactone decarboxylase [Ornithinimicrobium cerasi]